MVKRYITTIYPRLVREVTKEEAKEKFLAELKKSAVSPIDNLEIKVRVVKRKKVKENPMQMEFDFGEQLSK